MVKLEFIVLKALFLRVSFCGESPLVTCMSPLF
jgi:hypothetical protein